LFILSLETQTVFVIFEKIQEKILIYRVSFIKLDRVNGSKLRFGGQIRKFKKNESF